MKKKEDVGLSKRLATKNVAAVLLGVALVVTFAFAFASPAKAAEAYYPPSPAINAAIEEIAPKYGVDTDLALAIAWCESRFKVKAKNFNSNGTRDVGLFQINDIHIAELERLGLTRYEARENIIFAMKLMARNGTRDFRSSASCWQPVYSSLSLT